MAVSTKPKPIGAQAMTNEEKLRLLAYQWVVHGSVHDLSNITRLFVASRDATHVSVPYDDNGINAVEIVELHKLVGEDASNVWMCSVGYGERSKTFVMAPVLTWKKDAAITG